MGIHLGPLVVKRPTSWDELAGQRIAVDAYNTLYQFLATIRQADGTPLMDAQGRVTSHLRGLFARTAHMVEHGVRPVYVFDGRPHELKAETLAARDRIKQDATKAYASAIQRGDLETARSKAQQMSTLSREMVQQTTDMLQALGVPWVQAPGEGEAQAVAMARSGLVDGVASQDFDSVLFGAPMLYRNLSVGGRRKLPGRQAWVDVEPEAISLDETLHELGLTREQLIDVAIMMGTDYNHGIKGIGPKTALKLIGAEGSIEAAMERAAQETKGATWAKLRDGAHGIEPLATIRSLFRDPLVVDAEAPQWSRPDVAAAHRLLVDEFQFSVERVETTLARYGAGSGERAQRNLGEF